MSEEQGFLETLAANPGDDATRLVYADWLDERGDPLGSYLRLEIELARLAEHDARTAALEAQLQQLRSGIPSELAEVAGKRWDVWLLAYEPVQKIAVIKLIRELTNLGLAEAKDRSEALPVRISANHWRGEAEVHAARLRDVASGRVVAPDHCVAIRPASGPAPHPLQVSRPPSPCLIPPGSGPFDVYLVSYPAHLKINAIKVIREVTGVGLREAKDLSEGHLPARVREGVSADQGAQIRRAFDGIAVIEVRPGK
jgi:uncharacterized protein (TIGR02996 family)